MNVTHKISNLHRRVAVGVSAVVVAISAFIVPISAVDAANGNVAIEGSVKVANVTAGDTAYQKSVNAKVDDVVKVQVWYHNREDPESGKVANNLNVALGIPTTAGKAQKIDGTIKSDNSNTVADSANVNLSLDNASLEYVAGSAKWRHNKGAADGRTECQTGRKAVPADDPNKCYVTETVSDNIAKGGAGVNLENLQPCFAYEATVTVLMRVKASAVKVNKYVSSHDGDTDVKNNEWKLRNGAVPGDKLDYMIRFENKGNTTLKNIAVGDNLPDYMDYIPGSTRIITSNHPDGIAAGNDNVVKGGIDVGGLEPGATGYVVLSTKINDKTRFAKCGVYTLKNVGVVRPAGMNEYYNTATTDVTVKCDTKPTPPVTPENCEVPGKENLPKDSPECKEAPVTPETPETPETPTPETPVTPETPITPEAPAAPATPGVPAELPKTGASDGLMAALGLGSAVAAVAYVVTGRRNG